ncbi:hypothetical protein SCMU_00110 [Sinomonas cyclohexanicum]|uniref:DUF2971 domain-containing protein n=1 Tax=Sinomonas cyclohexanicum TaxID=322009 RepID=A0ABM7PPP1_SINCY|nr:DUF2971 domain-containing protein [Corynebacterium cyclohexanicum]BCT74169.1 hypothetical protein SCMU_00110 [Corynebacterium cyclohexanicum]
MSPLPDRPETELADGLSEKAWPPRTVWHYTDAKGLEGILRENVLWANSTAFMNDRHELLTGAMLLQELLERHKAYLEPKVLADIRSMLRYATARDRYKAFLACACEDPNNLTMWRNYTGNSVGFAIGIDSSKALSMRRQRPMTSSMLDEQGFHDDAERREVLENGRRPLGAFAWQEVKYDKEDHIKWAWGRLRELEGASRAHQSKSTRSPKTRPELDVMSDIYEDLQTIKDSGFKDERETRVLCWTALHTDLTYVKYRPNQYGIVPYVELGIPRSPDSVPGQFPEPMEQLPVVGIAVGPTPYPEEAASGVRELLRSVGRPAVAVIRLFGSKHGSGFSMGGGRLRIAGI